MDSALMEQSQRYKFVTDYHREWLKSYVELLKYINELVPNLQNIDNESKIVTSPSALNSFRNASISTPAASVGENHKTEVEVIINENATSEVAIANEDTELCKPTPSKVDDDFKWMTVTNEEEAPKHQETSSYFQNLKELTPLADDDGTLENFLLINPAEQSLSEYQNRRPITPPRKVVIIKEIAASVTVAIS
uniref:Ribonuclease H-like domain-containing protein n=1 Tax=Syphacia muris TaxID=451379 RepID=A0A0N5B144_9BILA